MLDQQTLKAVRNELFREIDRQNYDHDRRFIDGLGLATRIVGRMSKQEATATDAATQKYPTLDILFDRRWDEEDFHTVVDSIRAAMSDDASPRVMRITVTEVTE